MRKALIAMVLAGVTGWGCGSGAPPPPANKPAAKPAGGAGAGAAAQTGAALVLYPKVAKQYRKELTREDFTPDPTGNVNRDPFRSYLIESRTPAAGTVAAPDECEKRRKINGWVAEESGIRDLSLIGIILRGTRHFAMFADLQRVGNIVYEEDCLSKDKARVKLITGSCVTLEVRGEAAPGAPAPPARDEVVCLHPGDIQVE